MNKTDKLLNNFCHCFETLMSFFLHGHQGFMALHIVCIYKYGEQDQTLAWYPKTIKQKRSNKVKMKLDIQVLTGMSEFIERSAVPFL